MTVWKVTLSVNYKDRPEDNDASSVRITLDVLSSDAMRACDLAKKVIATRGFSVDGGLTIWKPQDILRADLVGLSASGDVQIVDPELEMTPGSSPIAL